MEFNKKNLIWAGIGVLMIIVSVIFLKGEKLLYFILVIEGIIVVLPFIISLILQQGKQKQKEEKFLEFTRDLVENVKSGTPVSKSILNLLGRNYGALSPHVNKLANQISLGITLTSALSTFAKETKSKVIARAVNLISEAERAGGQIDVIIESVSKSVNQTEELKKERKSAVYNLVVQGYIIFFVFIIIMLLLEFKILPMTAGLGEVNGGSLNINIKPISPEDFSLPLLIMLLIQSTFSGLVIGKISEGSLFYGIKHSFILLAATLLISTGVRAFLG